MLETKEARAKLRYKLETWPDDRKCPVTINQVLELLDMVDSLEEKLRKIELHEHYMIQWAKLDIEEAKKTIDWVHEIQDILGMKIGMTKNSRTEITAKIKELMAVDKEADWLADKLADASGSMFDDEMEYLGFQCSHECEQPGCTIECRKKNWHESARKAVGQQNERK